MATAGPRGVRREEVGGKALVRGIRNAYEAAPEEERAKEHAGRKPEGHGVLAAVEAADRWGERRVSYPGNPALLPVS
jgi:hypothetical protein